MQHQIRVTFTPNYVEPFIWKSNSKTDSTIETLTKSFEVLKTICQFDLGNLDVKTIKDNVLLGAINSYKIYLMRHNLTPPVLLSVDNNVVEIYDIQFNEWSQFQCIEEAIKFIEELESAGQ